MITLKSAYYYEHLSHDYVTNHNHDCFELVFYYHGKSLISVTNASYSVNAPTIAIIPPHLKHDEKEFSETQIYVVQYESDEKISNDIDIYALSEKQSEQLKEIFAQLVPYDLGKFNPKQIQQKTQEFSVILSLLQTYRFISKSDADQENAVMFVKNFIKKNYAMKIDYEALAATYGYSYSRLRHIFTNYTGVSIHKYCCSIRLTNAKRLLSDTNISIHKIASMCGFSSNTLFDIFFQKEMDISPKEFRQLVRQQEAGNVVRMGGKQL